jgi:cytochrome c oxidase subunit 2
MNDSFRLFPETASRAASEVNYLSLALLAIATLFSLGIMLAIVFFIARYWHTREVNRQSSHSNLLHWTVELSWMLGPLAILLGVFGWGAAVYIRAHRPPRDPIEVNVVAKQWMWKIAHESGQREINSLHVPAGRPVRLTMISEDVIHSFFVPAFRAKQDVLPGRYTTFWFEATRTGKYDLFCAEYCGTDHSRMVGTVVVQTPEEYVAWLDSLETEPLAQRGRRWVESFGCLRCHASLEGPQIGPPLTGLYGRPVLLADGQRAIADPAYLRRAILDPQAQLRVGYSSHMPSYEDQIDASQMIEIIAYLRSIADATAPLAGPGVEFPSGSVPGDSEPESPPEPKTLPRKGGEQ